MERDGLPVALITGASRGIGRETAQLLARSGYRVFAGVRDVDRAAVVQAYADRLNLPLELVQLDVTSQESTDHAIATIRQRAGRIDALVNNAGIGLWGPVEEHSDDDWRLGFETNVLGAVRVARAVLPTMREQRRGVIVNVSSIAARVVVPYGAAYASTKAALESISEGLRSEVAPFGVRVVVVAPGFFLTGFMERRAVAPAVQAGHSVYADDIARVGAVFDGMAQEGKPPSRVARAIAQVIARPNPPFRVTVGSDAKTVRRLRSLLPDPLFFPVLDRVFRSPRRR